MDIVINVLLAAIVLLAFALQRTYQALPVSEIKKRAKSGDEFARVLYRAAAFGYSLTAVLWFFIIVSSSIFFVRVATTSPTWLALLTTAIVAWFGFVWLPARKATNFGMRLARIVAPALEWLLNHLYPVVDACIAFVHKHRPISVHTGLYDKEDLIALLTQQQVQADNRITQAELTLAYNALTIGEKIVRDIMIPRRVVKMVNADEAVGPILMTEVHSSGHSRYPVYDGKKDNIVGTVYLRDLMKAKAGGFVRDVMRPADVCYIHEEQSLVEALQAILKTRRHMFIVVNSFEEYVGVITIEDVLEQIIGQPIVDEFDQYDDLRAVAAREAKIEHEEHEKKVIADIDADGIAEIVQV